MKTIIEIAREAGIEVTYDPTETPTRAFVECWIENLEHLVDLARADEREECAKVCEDLGMATNGMYERNHECATAIRARENL